MGSPLANTSAILSSLVIACKGLCLWASPLPMTSHNAARLKQVSLSLYRCTAVSIPPGLPRRIPGRSLAGASWVGARFGTMEASGQDSTELVERSVRWSMIAPANDEKWGVDNGGAWWWWREEGRTMDKGGPGLGDKYIGVRNTST